MYKIFVYVCMSARSYFIYIHILCFSKIARILFKNKIKDIFLISNNISIKIKLDLIEILKINFIIIERNLKKSNFIIIRNLIQAF